MPLDPDLQPFVDQMALLGQPPIEEQPLEVQRSAIEALGQLGRPVEGVDTRERMVPGGAGELHARVYRPEDADGPLPGLVFFHGGGFVIGSLDSHHLVCCELAMGARCAVVSVDYRLAPEYPFPAAVEDAVTATASVAQLDRELGVDAGRLGVGGDSAGANLALNAALAARKSGLPLRALVLVYPWVDLSLSRPSMDENARGYLLEKSQLMVWREMYAPEAEWDWDDPALSPLNADLSGLPPAVVATAGHDPLRDDGDALAAAMAEAGGEVHHLARPGLVHTYLHLTGLSAGCVAAVEEVAATAGKLLAG